MKWFLLHTRTTITMIRMVKTTKAPVTTPTNVSTATESEESSLPSLEFSLKRSADDEVRNVVSMVAIVVVVVVVVVVGKHSGEIGSPSNLLQLMNRWDPSLADIALMAFMLISLLMTSTCLVFLILTDPEDSLRKMQSLMMTLLVLSIVTLLGGRWLKVEDSKRKYFTFSIPILNEMEFYFIELVSHTIFICGKLDILFVFQVGLIGFLTKI